MTNLRLDTLEQAVKPHDKYQIEIKLDYELFEAKQTRYRISTYIFVPRNLGISQDNYRKSDFYRDVQSYIRLKTPPLNLRDFTENPISPLMRLKKLTSTDNWVNDATINERIVVNFKLLSAMLKSSIRDHLALIQQRIFEAAPNSKIHLLIHNLVEEFLTESKKITTQYRSFYAIFNLPHVPEAAFTAYQLTDESLSILIEENAVDLFQVVEAYIKKSERPNFKQRLSELVKQETKHRLAHGYESILSRSSDNETYIFRSSVLKKYAASVLYLSTAIKSEGWGLEQILFSIAAGISMIFATIVAFYFQYRYGNFTLPFFMALVVGYMFKDRIKEAGRAIFARFLQDRLYDRRTVIRTQNGKHKLGWLKEKMAFVQEEDVPKPVLQGRNKDLMTALDNDGLTENIICYTKEVVLYTKVFQKVFPDLPQITGLNNIIRYDIRAYLRKMAEPIQTRYYLQDEELQIIPGHKVYHLNFISRYRTLKPEKVKLHKRIRLILNQEGIKRVEHLEV